MIPETFQDLIGQDDVAKALTNAVRLSREPSALIFAGMRGIGKTTSARLFAKALNCEAGPTPEPCGQISPKRVVMTRKYGFSDPCPLPPLDTPLQLRQQDQFYLKEQSRLF